jgi:hypothetical protein
VTGQRGLNRHRPRIHNHKSAALVYCSSTESNANRLGQVIGKRSTVGFAWAWAQCVRLREGCPLRERCETIIN